MKMHLKGLSLLAVALLVVGCKTKVPDFEKLQEAVVKANETLTGYKQVDIILDGDVEVYTRTAEFTLTRGEVATTSYSAVEKKLNDNITTSNPDTYIETTTSYTTSGSVKTDSDGITSDYTLPTYFLAFDLVESYFENSVFEISGETMTFTSDVKSSEVYKFLLNKVNSGISDLSVKLIVTDGVLATYESSFIGKSGLPVKTVIDYNYNIA